MVRKTSWYRPADCVGFFPPTPGGELNQEINQVLKEEGRRINMNLRAVETGGASLGKMLVHPDLKRGEPCGRPGCVLDRTSGGAGGPHNVPSANYVKLKGNQPSIGVKAVFLDHIDVNNMKEK